MLRCILFCILSIALINAKRTSHKIFNLGVRVQVILLRGVPSIPPGGEPSVAPTRHWVTCGSKPGGWRDFFSLFVSCYLSQDFSSKICSVLVSNFGYPKAATHVAVGLQCWSL